METPTTSPLSADSTNGSSFRMIDVGEKPQTYRRARASGEIQLSAPVIERIQERSLPKGDVLALAEIAGIQGAKQTAAILPLCHPLLLESVKVVASVDPVRNVVQIECEVCTHARTGVEMEAMMGAQAALLCVYDLTKSLERGATISQVKLLLKEGGKSGVWRRETSTLVVEEVLDSHQTTLSCICAQVIVVSDRCARGERIDESGEEAMRFLNMRGADCLPKVIVADEVGEIAQAVQRACAGEAHVIVVSGGTGIGPRDVTPEALLPLFNKTFQGIGELLRSRIATSQRFASLSRCGAGLVGNSIVFMLPGSVGGVRDGLKVLEPLMPHMLAMVKGGGH